MFFSCDSNYIVLPASFNAQKKRLYFYIDDKLVLDLVVSLDNDEPDFKFPVNMQRFKGKQMRVECDCDMEIKFEMTNEPTLDYSGKYRPYVHFTSKRGWINDPNGLVYHNGKYLMYYQHNPAATIWENMHWGSAESTDLMHWKEKGDVLFPCDNGTIFSGSGIVDKSNVTSLSTDENPPILFFYTSAGDFSETSKGKPFTQRLAYSIDNGDTLTLYPNVIVEQIAEQNRDPKVIYYEQDNSYIMALFLENHDFAILKSFNLFDWTEIQRITMPSDAECPDFYPLCVSEEGIIKWVFSAASDRYFIGEFDGKHFEILSKELRLNYGNVSYAAQSWSDTKDGRRIRTAFANIVIPCMPFGCCMNIPQEMSLKRIEGELLLCAEPVKEISALYEKTYTFADTAIDGSHKFKAAVESKACDVKLRIRSEKDFRISLFGILVEYDSKQNLLKCDGCEASVKTENCVCELRIIYDTIYTEIFAQQGSVFMGISHIQDANLNNLEISSDNAFIENIEVSPMKRFYQ